MKLLNERTGQSVATTLEIASTSAERRRGLLGRDGLAPGAALVITRCNAVHTIGMRFAIDVAFVDSRGRVRKIVRALRPWRMACSPLASNAIEFAAGELDGRLQVGDRVQMLPPAA
jgi:uncharacterized membrane protein (UPF0127 family)